MKKEHTPGPWHGVGAWVDQLRKELAQTGAMALRALLHLEDKKGE